MFEIAGGGLEGQRIGRRAGRQDVMMEAVSALPVGFGELCVVKMKALCSGHRMELEGGDDDDLATGNPISGELQCRVGGSL